MENVFSGTGDALRASASFTGRKLVIAVSTDNVEVAKEVCKTVTKLGLGLGALYAGYSLLKPIIEGAVKKALGGDRDDQDTRDIRPGCLHVELHCFTDERFLEVLEDYQSGRIKERLQEELSLVGIKVEGLKVKIENMEEVNETKAAIEMRYRKTKDPGEITMNIDTSESEECSASSSIAEASIAIVLQEKENFTRLVRLLVDKGTEALRNVFDTIHPPARLPVVLAANKKSLLRLKFRVINNSQWDLLYPPSGKPADSKTFDVTLLTVLLRNSCGLPSIGWNAMPLDTDRSMQANIMRIKTMRNEVYAYVTSTRLDNATFESLWKKIAQTLVELGIPQKDLNKFKTSPLWLEGDVFEDVVKNWKLIDEQLQNDLQSIGSFIKRLRKITEEIKIVCDSDVQEQGDTEARQKRVTAHLAQLKEEKNIKINRYQEEDLLPKLTKHDFDDKIGNTVNYFLPGTREWLLKDVDDWFIGNKQESRILLLTAGPGFGKSVLAAKICENFKKKRRLAACYFLDSGDLNLRNPMMILQSLAIQMCKNIPGFKEKLLDQLKQLHEIHTIEDALQVYLRSPLNELEVEEPSLVVIDGLDEIAADDKNEIVNLIADYFSDLPDCVKFLATSRPETSIAKLRDLPKINIKNSDARNNLDIQIYFKSGLPILLERDEDSYRQLADMCEGSFLYAYYLQSELKKRDDLAKVTLDEIIEFLPKGHASVYLAYFRRLEDEVKALKPGSLDILKVLKLLVAARGPLPLSFVAKALGLAPDCRETKRIINKVNDAISCLLYVADDLVTVFHKSVIDWLLARGYEDHEYAVTIDDGNKSLWLICEQEFANVKKNIRETAHQQNRAVGVTYALTYGFYHLVACNMQECLPWLVDSVIVYAILLNNPFAETVHLLQSLWTKVLYVNAVISDELSCCMLALQYITKKARPSSYLERVLTLPSSDYSENYEKIIAQIFLPNISVFGASQSTLD